MYQLTQAKSAFQRFFFIPAVSLAFYVAKGLTLAEMFWYFLAQLIGGITGTGFTALTGMVTKNATQMKNKV